MYRIYKTIIVIISFFLMSNISLAETFDVNKHFENAIANDKVLFKEVFKDVMGRSKDSDLEHFWNNKNWYDIEVNFKGNINYSNFKLQQILPMEQTEIYTDISSACDSDQNDTTTITNSYQVSTSTETSNTSNWELKTSSEVGIDTEAQVGGEATGGHVKQSINFKIGFERSHGSSQSKTVSNQRSQTFSESYDLKGGKWHKTTFLANVISTDEPLDYTGDIEMDGEIDIHISPKFCIYKSKNYKNSKKCYHTNQNKLGSFDNNTKSIKFDNKFSHTRLWRNQNFKGENHIFNTSDKDLTNNKEGLTQDKNIFQTPEQNKVTYANAVSSIKVYGNHKKTMSINSSNPQEWKEHIKHTVNGTVKVERTNNVRRVVSSGFCKKNDPGEAHNRTLDTATVIKD